MLSRNETIEQILSRMKPQEPSAETVSFSGTVAQVNVISHATINIESLQIFTGTEPDSREGSQETAKPGPLSKRP